MISCHITTFFYCCFEQYLLVKFSWSLWLKFVSIYYYCVESVLIWSYSGPHFPTFRLNTERYGVFSPNPGNCRPECVRIRPLFPQCVTQKSIHIGRNHDDFWNNYFWGYNKTWPILHRFHYNATAFARMW